MQKYSDIDTNESPRRSAPGQTEQKRPRHMGSPEMRHPDRAIRLIVAGLAAVIFGLLCWLTFITVGAREGAILTIVCGTAVALFVLDALIQG